MIGQGGGRPVLSRSPGLTGEGSDRGAGSHKDCKRAYLRRPKKLRTARITTTSPTM